MVGRSTKGGSHDDFHHHHPDKAQQWPAGLQKEMTAMLAELREEFGGFTTEGPVNGEWRDERTGRVYRDRGIKVTVACDRERFADAIEAVMAIGRRLAQEAMWFEVRGADGVSILTIE